jgi:hypothetical protein
MRNVHLAVHALYSMCGGLRVVACYRLPEMEAGPPLLPVLGPAMWIVDRIVGA